MLRNGSPSFQKNIDPAAVLYPQLNLHSNLLKELSQDLPFTMASTSYMQYSTSTVASPDAKRRRISYDGGSSSSMLFIGGWSRLKTIRFNIPDFLNLVSRQQQRPGEVFVNEVPLSSRHPNGMGQNYDEDLSLRLEGFMGLDGCIIFYLVCDKKPKECSNRSKVFRAKWTYSIGSSFSSKSFDHTFDFQGDVLEATGGAASGFFRWLKYTDVVVASNFDRYLDHHGNLVVDVNIQVYKEPNSSDKMHAQEEFLDLGMQDIAQSDMFGLCQEQENTTNNIITGGCCGDENTMMMASCGRQDVITTVAEDTLMRVCDDGEES